MSSFVKAMDSMPMIVKIILALPALDIIWNIYRVVRSAAKKNVLGIVLGIILIIVGIPFMWLVDIISIIICNKVLWID